MSERQYGHLTEDEFSAAMLDEPLTPAAGAHLAVCPECQTEVNTFSLATGDFRRTAKAWSEQRSSKMMPVRPTRSSARGGRSEFAPAYAWGAAGLMAIGVTLSVVGHLHHEQGPATATEQISDEDSPEQIARDNELLAQVHFELTKKNLPGMQASVPGGKIGRRPQ